MPDFNKDDVIAVAKAILEDWRSYDCDDGTTTCNHCFESEFRNKLKHESNCVVLIAQDLLT